MKINELIKPYYGNYMFINYITYLIKPFLASEN